MKHVSYMWYILVHFGTWYMWYIYGTYVFVSNYVLCIRIKPKGAYEVMWIYYIISTVYLRHVSSTFCVLLQEGTVVKYQCIIMKCVLCVCDIDQIYTADTASG